MRIRSHERDYTAPRQARSVSTSEGVLSCSGAQVVLRLADGSRVVGEIVRAIHVADGAVTLSLRPWGVSHPIAIPKDEIASATVASMSWQEHHTISCEQARRFRT